MLLIGYLLCLTSKQRISNRQCSHSSVQDDTVTRNEDHRFFITKELIIIVSFTYQSSIGDVDKLATKCRISELLDIYANINSNFKRFSSKGTMMEVVYRPGLTSPAN